LYLFSTAGQLLNSVEFGFQVKDLSIGLSGGVWRLLGAPTPAAANSAPATLGSPANIRFNEWMASPLSGDDWFELHNLDSAPVELSGLYLSDDPSLIGLSRYAIAPLTFIGANGFVKWMADGDPSRGGEHVNFNLDALGETLLLSNPNLSLIDAVYFGLQTDGVSQGRLP